MKDYMKQHTHECGRGADLVAYIYGETDASGAADFARHLARCAKCADEAAAFGFARNEFAAWRAAAPQLGASLAGRHFDSTQPDHAIATESTADAAPLPLSLPPLPARSWKQARAALADFFRVCPRWLQASGATAALALCALLGVLAFNANVQSPLAGNSTPPQEEFDSRVAREVARRLDAMQQESPRDAQSVAVAINDDDALARPAQSRAKPARTPRERVRRAAPSAARQAEQVDDGDDELPRLSDLLYGAD